MRGIVARMDNPFRTLADMNNPPVSIGEIHSKEQQEAFSAWCSFAKDRESERTQRSHGRATAAGIVLGLFIITGAVVASVVHGQVEETKQQSIKSKECASASTSAEWKLVVPVQQR